MNIKKISAHALAMIMSASLLTSCASAITFDKEFVEVKESKYSSVVENSALTIYVDANAKDNGDGSESAPFKTIPEAQAKIRKLKSGDGLPAGGITVFVKDGEYRITEGIVFTEEDSGTEDCPITYVSESEFGAKITGALLLSAEDFEPINEEEKSRLMDKSAAEKIVKVDLTKYGLTSDDLGEYIVSGSHHTGEFYEEYAEAYENADAEEIKGGNAQVPMTPEAEVFIGDKVLQCAQWPNEDWIYAKSLVYFGQSTWEKSRGDIINPDGPILGVDESVMERISKWSTHENIWSSGYISTTWADSRNKVEKFDYENNTVQFRYSETFLSEGHIEAQTTRWFFFNIFDELDTEGEFYIDRENGILYIYKTVDFSSERIKMSTLAEDIITLDNVSNITLKGFYISETRENGIMGTAENFTVDNCKICNIRSGAIRIHGNKITVQNNEICNLGTYGIFLEGGDMETLTRSENVIHNNYIHDWARVVKTYQSGVQVEGVGSLVSHNEMCNSPHQAVTWHGPYHVMEYNEVYDLQKETSDCGAFYSGKNLWSYGCIVRYNYIHDIGFEGADASGIYWDDGLSGQTAYGNIIVNVSGNGIIVGAGRDNTVTNNLIINPGRSPIWFDQRYRDAIISNGKSWNVDPVLLSNELLSYLNDTWYEAFPVYKDIILYFRDYDGDLNDPRLSINPANCVVKDNACYKVNETKVKHQDENVYQKINLYSHWKLFDSDMFSTITDNPIIYNDFSDFPGWHNGDFTMIENPQMLTLNPNFEPIPFDIIGRID